MKRIISLLLCLLMVMSLSVTAFAEDTEPSLIINGKAPGHTFVAYQIFKGEVHGSTLSDPEWGSGIAESMHQTLLNDLLSDTYQIYNSADPTYPGTTMKEQLSGVSDLDGLISKMKTWGNNLDRIDYFAHFLMYGSKSNTADVSYLSDTCYTSDEQGGNVYHFYDLPAGYYLVVDTTEESAVQGTDNDFYTKFMIQIVGDTVPEVTVKGDVPQVTKQVSSKLGSGYTEHISNQLNKLHYYKWEGTIPSNIGSYDYYTYIFHDTLSAGLDFNRIETIYIDLASGNDIYIFNRNDPAANEEGVLIAGMMPECQVVQDDSDGTTKLTVGWDNLLEHYPSLESSDKIVIEYSAMLNENAVVAKEGTENEVELEFSNSPNDDEKTGFTPPDESRVYTFGLEVTKTNGSGKNLEGAEFYLYHNHTEIQGSTTVNVPVFARIEEVTVDGVTQKRVVEWVQDYKVNDNGEFILDDQGNKIPDTDYKNVPGATRLVSDANGKIEVSGLKDNTIYHLIEVVAPKGYNTLERPATFRITGYTLAEDQTTVAQITYTVEGIDEAQTAEGENAKVSLEVVNSEGTVLPSTGGMGTTILYIAGGILVLAAVVLLVTKKRMERAE